FDLSEDGRFIAIARPFVDDHARTPSGSVTLIRATGDTMFHHAFSFPGVPIPKSVADSAISASAQAWKMTAGDAAAFRRGAYVPPFYPPVGDIVVGKGGT
ncbi:MAG: hypothetical protein ACREX0_20335, partial [Noviherbaspirillum sp.]